MMLEDNNRKEPEVTPQDIIDMLNDPQVAAHSRKHIRHLPDLVIRDLRQDIPGRYGNENFRNDAIVRIVDILATADETRAPNKYYSQYYENCRNNCDNHPRWGRGIDKDFLKENNLDDTQKAFIDDLVAAKFLKEDKDDKTGKIWLRCTDLFIQYCMNPSMQFPIIHMPEKPEVFKQNPSLLQQAILALQNDTCLIDPKTSKSIYPPLPDLDVQNHARAMFDYNSAYTWGLPNAHKVLRDQSCPNIEKALKYVISSVAQQHLKGLERNAEERKQIIHDVTQWLRMQNPPPYDSTVYCGDQKPHPSWEDDFTPSQQEINQAIEMLTNNGAASKPTNNGWVAKMTTSVKESLHR